MMFSRLSGFLRALKSKAVSGSEAHLKSFDRLSAETVVENLRLESHVEGGFFRRTYASDYRLQTPTACDRSSMTSIFYLLATQSPIGHFHINRSDIVHYFHLGDPISYYLIHLMASLKL